MTIFIGSEEKRVGLALSGGGFRAAAFHLGVFRKLHQLGLLWKLDLLTRVIPVDNILFASEMIGAVPR